MASEYPEALDAFDNPSAATPMNSSSTPHALQHANVNDAVEALEAKLGIGSSAAAAASAGDLLTRLEDGTTGWSPSGRAVINVADYATVADAVAALPAPTWETYTDGRKRFTGGGSVLYFPRSIYLRTEPIPLPPMTTVLIEGQTKFSMGAAVATFTSDLDPNVYDQNGICIIGLGTVNIDGAGLGTYALDLERATKGSIRNLRIQRFTVDGVRLQRCQWLDLIQVECVYNDGVGIHLDESVTDGGGTMNCSLFRCLSERNGVGGLLVGQGSNNVSFGCTYQFNGEYGIRHVGGSVTGGTGNRSNGCIGCHLEGQPVHVTVDYDAASGRPGSSFFNDCNWVVSDVVERFVRNAGGLTTIKGGATQASGLDLLGALGTNAPFENTDLTVCTMIIDAFPEINDLDALVCDELGNNIPAGVTSWKGVKLIPRTVDGIATARKAADESVNNSAVLQDDDELRIPLEVNAVYEVECFLIYDAATGADLKYGFAVTGGGVSFDWVGLAVDTTSTTRVGTPDFAAKIISSTATAGGGGPAAKAVARVSGVLVTTGAAPGDLKLQWAQNTAHVSDTTVRSGSLLRARRIA